MPLRRPRRIFRSSPSRPSLGLLRLAASVRPLHLGLGAIVLLGAAVLAFAGPLSSAGPLAGVFAGRSSPSVRVEAAAGDIAVVDGSTLRLAKRVVRLLGIETPERGQTCQGAGATGSSPAASPARFDCAAAAAAALASLVRERRVACDVRDTDSMGRPLAICDAGGRELNLALVADGWARAGNARGLTGNRPEILKKAELLARREHRGLWAPPPAATR